MLNFSFQVVTHDHWVGKEALAIDKGSEQVNLEPGTLSQEKQTAAPHTFHPTTPLGWLKF